MSATNNILVPILLVLTIIAQMSLTAKLNASAKTAEDESPKTKSKRNYDAYRHGNRFGLPPVLGQIQRQNQPGYDIEDDIPHHRTQEQGYPHPQGQPQVGYAGTGQSGSEPDHERDIMAAQNTMNLYYDDLVRLQSLMSNMITDPHADEGDYSDY